MVGLLHFITNNSKKTSTCSFFNYSFWNAPAKWRLTHFIETVSCQINDSRTLPTIAEYSLLLFLLSQEWKGKHYNFSRTCRVQSCPLFLCDVRSAAAAAYAVQRKEKKRKTINKTETVSQNHAKKSKKTRPLKNRLGLFYLVIACEPPCHKLEMEFTYEIEFSTLTA